MRFMVRFVVRDPGSDEVISRIPAERERIGQLAKEGTIEVLYLAADRSSGWIVMRGPSVEAVAEALASLPLHPYMDVELTAIQD